VTLAFFGLWSIFWFTMEARIEGEIERWVDKQGAHGTEVSYASLDITGYPFRLVATFDDPHIVSQEDPGAFTWSGESLRIITQVWDINRVIIELLGRQSVSWAEAPDDGSRSSSQIMIDFTGEKLRGSLHLADGRIQSIDTDFTEVTADIFGDGAFALIPDLPEHLDIAQLEYHSRLVKSERDGRALTSRDVMVLAKDIRGGSAPAPDMTEGIEEILVAFSEELAAQSRLHSGDIGSSLPPALAQSVDIHSAHIIWQPVSMRLDGELGRQRSGNFDGKVRLYLKGHEDLVRRMAARGDLPGAAAMLAGALFGVLSLVSETNEAGELVIPLDVKDGDVYFGFLPLFDKEDYR
jgi:hypothetical protein